MFFDTASLLSKDANDVLKKAHKVVYHTAKKIAKFRKWITWLFAFGLTGLGMQGRSSGFNGSRLAGLATRAVVGAAALAAAACASAGQQAGSSDAPLRIYGNVTTIELAPVHLAIDAGLYDITGNVREITRFNSTVYRLMGGAFNTQAESGGRCDFEFYSVSQDFKLYDTGFRCCFDSDPRL